MKVSFAVIGGITGYTLTRTVLLLQMSDMADELRIALLILIPVSMALIFYTTGVKTLEMLSRGLENMEKFIQKMTLYELIICSIGLIVGLVVANLITIPVNKIDIIGVPISVLVNILLGCIGIGIAIGKRNDLMVDAKSKHVFFRTSRSQSAPKIIDTNVLIDGRIVDIIRSRFLEGELIVPSFVLEEIRHIADSGDALKRNRGRRGLDVLNIIQKELDCQVRVETIELTEGAEVDNELLKAAVKFGAKVLTIDYNLAQVANFQGVPVLNINELANAVKPIALPGEDMVVQVIKDGKENGQGVGYLEDGTMIVIDGGRRHIGESLNVTVTSVLQTAAGRMIFAKPKCNVERAI